MHHRRQLGAVAHHKEARRHRAHQQVFGADNVHLALAHQCVSGDGFAHQPPCGQRVGQVHLNGGLAVRVGAHAWRPVSSVRKVAPDFHVGAHRAAAAAALDFFDDLFVEPVHRLGQAGGGADAQPAPAVEKV